MSAALPPQWLTQALTDVGAVASGARLYSYVSGTSTAAPLYADEAGTTPHDWPLVFDSAGRPPAYFMSYGVAYRFVLKTRTEATLTEIDPVKHPIIGSIQGLTEALAGLQPIDSDLTAIAALSTTSFGRSLLTLNDAAAARAALGLAPELFRSRILVSRGDPNFIGGGDAGAFASFIGSDPGRLILANTLQIGDMITIRSGGYGLYSSSSSKLEASVGPDGNYNSPHYVDLHRIGSIPVPLMQWSIDVNLVVTKIGESGRIRSTSTMICDPGGHYVCADTSLTVDTTQDCYVDLWFKQGDVSAYMDADYVYIGMNR